MAEPTQSNEEPAGNEPVVDPPEASASEATDVERRTENSWVKIDQMATVTLPSGASYVLNAGDVLELPPQDADFVIDEGYGSRADAPSGE
jgi:hypothetical protein